MAERGWNPFVKAFVYFVRSFKPSYWRRREVLVGKDHLGNQYFEIKADPSRGIRKPTRSFVPPHPDDWDVPLPPEWNAWLRMQRPEPPTPEESMANLRRIQSLEQRFAKKPPRPSLPTDGSFPKFPEYEETAGSKYK